MRRGRVYLAVILLQAAVFLPMAAFRLIDADEGFYAYAAKAVMGGELPYRDFFYTQMPALPYVYGAWSAPWDFSWYAARFLSAALAVTVGVLLFRHAARRLGEPALGAVGVAFYALNGLTLGWFTVVKTYSLSTALLLGAYVVMDREDPPRRDGRWLLGGLLVGLAIDTRLIFAAAVPAFLLMGIRAAGPLGRKLRSVGAFASGAVVGLIPAAMLLALVREQFLFDNLGFHGRRTPGGLIGRLPQKLETAGELFGLGPPGAGGAQFLLVVVLALAATVTALALRRRVPVSLYIAALLGGASLLPTPTWVQYFSVTTPFLVMGCVEVAADVRFRLRAAGRTALPVAARVGVVAAALLYLGLATPEVHRYAVSGLDVPGIRKPASAVNWQPETVREVSAMITESTAPGEAVLSWWPGYVFETHATSVPGLESTTYFLATRILSPDRWHDYRVLSRPDVVALIREHRTRIVVLGNWAHGGPWRKILEENGYRLIGTVASTRLYRAST